MLLPWGIFCLAVIAICDHFGRLSMSMPLLMMIAVFGFFFYLKWELRRQPLFWSVIALLAVLHIGLVWSIPWSSDRVATGALAGGGSIDLCLMFLLLAAVEVLLKGQATAKK